MTTNQAVMTFDALKKDIEEYAERHDEPFISQIPRFIMLAENRIASEVRGLGQIKIVNGTMEGAVMAKPLRWRETASMNVSIGTVRKILFERGYEYCRVFAPDSSRTGEPRYYCDYGYEHWMVVPTPPSQYPFEICYYERPEPLSESRQTNWTTQNAPQLILYASLLEAMPFLKNDERIQTFQAFYQSAHQAVTAEAKRRAFDRSAGMRE